MYKLVITQQAWDKVQHWINKPSSDEISGFGRVVHDQETNTFTVIDAYMLKQKGGAAHTEIDSDSLCDLMADCHGLEGELKWWWHSHVNMDVFWSGTDTDTIKGLGKNGWIVATVFNKRAQYKSAVSYKVASPFGTDVVLHPDIDTVISKDIDQELVKQWDIEYEANKPPVYTPSYTSNYNYNGHKSFLAGGHDTKTSVAGKRKSIYVNGLWGYGLEYEARICGMSVSKYEEILDYGTTEEIERLELILEREEMRGYGY